MELSLPVPLVSAEWLHNALGFPGLAVMDVRWVPGVPDGAASAFAAGHIPGAAFIDSDADLAGTPFVDGPGRHPLPSIEVFVAKMASLGVEVGEGARVVAYDDAGGSYAARLWWMLDALGHPEVAVLDSGLAAWGEPVEVGPPSLSASVSDPGSSGVGARSWAWPRDLIADADDVRAGLVGGAVVLDARAPERYRGETEPIDPVAGHIPGAISAPWAANLGQDGRFLEAGRLRQRYLSLGVEQEVEEGGGRGAIAHCGSGLTACHDILAMRVAGLGRARLYEGSWSDWVHDPAREVATGAAPGTLPPM